MSSYLERGMQVKLTTKSGHTVEGVYLDTATDYNHCLIIKSETGVSIIPMENLDILEAIYDDTDRTRLLLDDIVKSAGNDDDEPKSAFPPQRQRLSPISAQMRRSQQGSTGNIGTILA